jgi:Protein of unknown function (DUF1441)
MSDDYTPSAGDEQSLLMIYEGLNQTQLCKLFRLDKQTVREALLKVKPDGKRRGAAIYRMYNVAPYLVKPEGDFETYIKNANHTDLPKALTKEFWAGQRMKQDYLLKAGDLWPTQKVVEKVGELMKLVAMSTRLFKDAVDRNTELTDRQKSVIQSLSDGMLADLHKKVAENFSKPEGVDVELSVDDDDL